MHTPRDVSPLICQAYRRAGERVVRTGGTASRLIWEQASLHFRFTHSGWVLPVQCLTATSRTPGLS